MAHTVEDITELIRYHLVAAAPSDQVADRNLRQLVRAVEPMITRPVDHEPIYWLACEECGAWVSSELIGPDRAGETAEGAFRCTDCRFAHEGDLS